MPIAIYTHIGDVLMESRINWNRAEEIGCHSGVGWIRNKFMKLSLAGNESRPPEDAGETGPRSED
jgi:hypothetical protein